MSDVSANSIDDSSGATSLTKQLFGDINDDDHSPVTQSQLNSHKDDDVDDDFILKNTVAPFGINIDRSDEIIWSQQKEYIIFSNQLNSLKKSNIYILNECKENKRLLDLKYDDLTRCINNIQTSVILFSTLSGFMQATRIQFMINDIIISVVSITISTYITLLLSVSKYYKLDEIKESIQNLRAKYSMLQNKIKYRIDKLGPWNEKTLWEYQSASEKLKEWNTLYAIMIEDYDDLIKTKQELVSEFQIIMDTKSRNKYYIKDKELNYGNRKRILEWTEKEHALEDKIDNKNIAPARRSSIVLQHEAINTWEDGV